MITGDSYSTQAVQSSFTSTKNAKVRLSFDADEVPKFLEFLERVRDKYAEWSNTAVTNQVRGFSKKMPIEMKSKGGIWSLFYVDGKPPRSTFDMNRQWEFHTFLQGG